MKKSNIKINSELQLSIIHGQRETRSSIKKDLTRPAKYIIRSDSGIMLATDDNAVLREFMRNHGLEVGRRTIAGKPLTKRRVFSVYNLD